MKTCNWVLQSGESCGESVRYKMADDGGEADTRKVREYKAFCDKHEEMSRQLKELEDSDLPEEEHIQKFNEIVGK